MKVGILCEDHSTDRYILKPILEELMARAGRPRARVYSLDLLDPVIKVECRGPEAALSQSVVEFAVRSNCMIDLFILVVDRDCDRQKNSSRAEERAAENTALVHCLAVEEIEVWMLALHRIDPELAAIQADRDLKAAYAWPFLASRGWARGIGVKPAMKSCRERFGRLIQLCPEVADLGRVIQDFCGADRGR